MKKHLKPSRSKLVENYMINNKIMKLTKEARSHSKNSIIFSVIKSLYVYFTSRCPFPSILAKKNT